MTIGVGRITRTCLRYECYVWFIHSLWTTENPMDTNTLNLGERILLARRRKGLEQKQVAQAVGVSAPLVGKWERNESSPTLNAKIRLATVLDVPLDQFCTDEDIIDLRSALEVGIRTEDGSDVGNPGSPCNADDRSRDLVTA
jgi:DNA-binding XRE family transcriptional regulator